MASEESETADPAKPLRLTLTVVACLLALGHLIFPKLAVDTITLALLLAAVVPWLAPLFKSFETPWLKVEFREQIKQLKGQVETLEVAATRDEKRISLTVQMQKLIFLTGQFELEAERYDRADKSLEEIVFRVSRTRPEIAAQYQKDKPVRDEGRATFAEFLTEAHNIKSQTRELLGLLEDPRSAIPGDLSETIAAQIGIMSRQVEVLRNLNAHNAKVAASLSQLHD